jgi:hypothetical protein
MTLDEKDGTIETVVRHSYAFLPHAEFADIRIRFFRTQPR